MKASKVLETPILHISTLGSFDIKVGEESVLNKISKSHKISELLKYFLAFKEKKLLPEAIIDQIWPDNDSQDPKNVLRTQIFRVRKLFDETSIKGDCDKCLDILFVGGYYILKLGEKVSYDAAQFEHLIKDANKLKSSDQKSAIALYKQAIQLYKGDYLAEDSYSEWIVPLRNHYNRLYIQSLFDMIELLKETGDFSQIIELCEEAIKIEPSEEALHIYFMEALLKQGQIKYAMSHYDYASAWLYKELEIKPSNAMKNMYRKIQNYNEENGEADISTINSKLEEDLETGALYCDIDYFKFMYNLSKRRSERQEGSDYIGLATLMSRNNGNGMQIGEAMNMLKDTFKASLRKNDLCSCWNDNQLIFILSNPSEECLESIERRIFYRFESRPVQESFNLKIKFRPITNNNNIDL